MAELIYIKMSKFSLSSLFLKRNLIFGYKINQYYGIQSNPQLPKKFFTRCTLVTILKSNLYFTTVTVHLE
jgi:hypothetical protein